MFCGECGSPLNDTDKFCAKCGAKVELPPATEAVPEETPAAETLAGAAPSEAVSEETPVEETPAGAAPSEAVSAETPTEETPAEAPVKEYLAPAVPEEPVKKPRREKKPKKEKEPGEKKKLSAGKIVFLSIGIVLVLLLVLVVLNASSLDNFVHKNFSSPEKYYQWVEKQTAKKWAASISGAFDVGAADTANAGNTSASGELSFELGDGASALLDMAGLTGVNLAWLEQAGITIDTVSDDNRVDGSIGLSINKSNVLSCKVVMDMEEPLVYFQVPELAAKWMGFREDALEDLLGLDSYYWDSLLEAQEMNASLISAYPDAATVEKLAEKYLNLAFGCMDDVKKDSKTLKAGGVSQKCTSLKVTIDEDTLEELSGKIMDEMEEDKELREMFDAMAEAYDQDMDADDLYEDFLDMMNDALDELAYTVSYGDIIMTVWVDDKGVIRGRSIECEDSYDSVKVQILTPDKGAAFGYEMLVEADEESILIDGSGKKSGNSMNGEFQLEYDGNSLLELVVKDFDTESASRGLINGTFEIVPADGIRDALDNAMGASLLKDLQFTLVSRMEAQSVSVEIEVKYDKDYLGKIIMNYSSGEGEEVSFPSDADVLYIESESDLTDWIWEIDYEGFLSQLQNANLPSYIIDALEDPEGLLYDLMWYFY